MTPAPNQYGIWQYRSGHLIDQQYLPDEAAGRVIYRPARQGREAETAERREERDRRLSRPPRRG